MKRFRFTLDRLRRIRAAEERIARDAVKEANRVLRDAEAAAAEAAATRSEARDHLLSCLASLPRALPLLPAADRRLEALAALVASRRAVVAERERALAEKASDYRAARSRTRALENLRARRFEAYLDAVSREEQKHLEEAAINSFLAKERARDEAAAPPRRAPSKTRHGSQTPSKDDRSR